MAFFFSHPLLDSAHSKHTEWAVIITGLLAPRLFISRVCWSFPAPAFPGVPEPLPRQDHHVGTFYTVTPGQKRTQPGLFPFFQKTLFLCLKAVTLYILSSFLAVMVEGQVWLWTLYYVLKCNFIFEIEHLALRRRMG